MIDAESFPLSSTSEPSMVKAALPDTTKQTPLVYTLQDVKNLQDYAYNLGVLLKIEIDIPGHAASWNIGKPSIMANCMAKYYYNINNWALNPALDETYTTISNVLSDLVPMLTSSNHLHLGGDEVVYGCWSNDTSVVNFMKSNNIANYDSLLMYFVNKLDANTFAMMNKANPNFKITHWEEVFTASSKATGVAKLDASKTIYQVWTDSSMVSTITTAGYKVIASPSNYWYLNIQTNTWQVMYSYDPYTNLTTTQQNQIVGGEVALWGEYIDDTNIISNLYPRANSVGERLWSPSTVVDQTDALNRMYIQRCRMINRGINSAPIGPAGYCTDVYV